MFQYDVSMSEYVWILDNVQDSVYVSYSTGFYVTFKKGFMSFITKTTLKLMLSVAHCLGN